MGLKLRSAMETEAVPKNANRWLLWLVCYSFVLFAIAVVLRVGIGATPYETKDSLGRTMGFNDPLFAEHYTIMISNFHLGALLAWEYLYEWFLLFAHVAGAILLLRPTLPPRVLRWYFGVQTLLFPFGILVIFGALVQGVLALSKLNFGFLKLPVMDREGFVDVPFIWCVAHPIWILTAAAIAFAVRPRGERPEHAQQETDPNPAAATLRRSGGVTFEDVD